jgi:hypothetical protein
MLEKLLRAELAELKGPRKDVKLVMRRLDAINESLAPTSQEAKEELNARKRTKSIHKIAKL